MYSTITYTLDKYWSLKDFSNSDILLKVSLQAIMQSFVIIYFS